MVGQTISHYRILEELGGGGMGVVYKALDLRLNRFVALKFLSPELTKDRDANQRFRQEAQAASALDHPNICTIHEIDETPSGELFLTMAYYEGATLRSRIAGDPLGVLEAMDVAVQTAQGLARAHQSGIVHRDVKPANLIVGPEGVVKIVDFGLAKLTGQSDVTRTGTILGTVAYMSPEQARGDALDARTDVWSLGVVLYEMLTGRRPFVGKDDVAVLSRILDSAPEPVGKLRADVPPGLQQIVAKALDRNLSSRYRSATEMLADLTACRTAMATAPRGVGRRFLRKPVVAAAAVAALLATGIPIALAARRSARERWARNEALPEIGRLSEAGNTQAAFALAREVERILPGDQVLAGLRNQFSVVGSIVTTPEAADVYIQPYGAADDQWEHLGRTPLKDVRLARGVFRIRIEKQSLDTRLLAARNPGIPFNNLGAGRSGLPPFAIALQAAGSTPGMVAVPGGVFPVGLTGFNTNTSVNVPPFLIDRREVTNREFKPFVDAGGYKEARHWAELPFKGDRPEASWTDEVRTFVDSTGRLGPSHWELGDFPAGQADYPVGGVSWYEAAAYCRAAGKTLPTMFHWARAALSPVEIASALAPAIIPLSNFARKGPAPVGSFRGLGPYGTDDMAGNAREWVWNEASDRRRWILGGSWSDADYLFTVPNSLPASDRSAANGFRCAKYDPAAMPADLDGKVETYLRDHRTAQPVSNEVYDVFKRQYAQIRTPPNARVEARDTSNNDWIRETLSFDAGYEPGRIVAYLFLPRRVAPPYQVVAYFPTIGPFISRRSSADVQPGAQDFIVRAGRALVMPVYKGAWERWDPFLSLKGAEYLRTFRARMGHWRQDLGLVLDVLAERKDIDLTRLAYYSNSFGASTALPLIALEERLKTAILAAPGYTYRELPPEADAINYASRIRIPVLMMGGRHDYIHPLETAQKPLFDQLGTPPAHKRHVVLDAGHGLPRPDVIRQTIAWLDRYLGPVGAAKPSAR